MQVAKEFETILLNDLVKKFNSIFQIPVYLLNRTELTTSHNISNWTVNSQSLSVNTVNSPTNDITSNVSRLMSTFVSVVPVSYTVFFIHFPNSSYFRFSSLVALS